MKHEVTTYHTKKMFADALKNTLRTKPLSKVSVSEIIAICGVNRKTFYYHFQDIYALFCWVIDEEALKLMGHFDLMEDYEDAIRFGMNYVAGNDYIVNCLQDSVGREELKRLFRPEFIRIILSVIEKAEEKTDIRLDAGFKQYAAGFYTEALVGMMIEWAQNREWQNREISIRYLSRIVGSNIENLVLQMERFPREK